MLLKDQQSRVEEFVKALNQHDLHAFTAFYAKDCTVIDPEYPEPLKGHDAVRKDFEKTLTEFPDMKYTLKGVAANEDTAAIEVIARATHKGDLPGPAGPIRATKRTIELRIAAFERINDQGLITEERRYYDLAGLRQQLGQMAA
jgi:steroid delta-isomerase-like uncharacterized protein